MFYCFLYLQMRPRDSRDTENLAAAVALDEVGERKYEAGRSGNT